MQAVPLALEELRRGGVVVLVDGDTAHLVLAAECASAATIGLLTGIGAGLRVALGEADRLRAGLSLADTPCPTAVAPAACAQSLRRIADSSAGPVTLAGLPSLPALSAEAGSTVATAAVDLLRVAGLAPVVALSALRPDATPAEVAEKHGLPLLTVSDLALHRQRTEAMLDLVSVADLPTAYSDTAFRAHSFQSRFDGTEHMALVAPGKPDGAPLVRVHSECLTGDAFGSLRCDCGPQLHEAMRRLSNSPGGILIYLRGQEGRGIGLANKMRAYALQDDGLDTVEANRALGLPDDARDYAQAAQMLRALGHRKVRLLSNNPDKVAALRRHGITVTGLEPLVIPPNPFNQRYLETKAQKFGHALPLRKSLPAE